MHVDVIPSIGEAKSDDLLNKTVIVIDAIRATSTIVTALHNGCAGVVPVETVGQARQCKGADDLLGGERFCKRISGFDLGNSPLEYTRDAVEGRKIIMTTTNGTRAIQKSIKASHVLAGSFLNARAAAEAACGFRRDIVVVCAGTQDVFSLEDGLCGGMVVEEIAGIHPEVQLNDFAVAMRLAYRQCGDRLLETIMDCANGQRMCKLGFKEDVLFVARKNVFSTVPVLRGAVMESLERQHA